MAYRAVSCRIPDLAHNVGLELQGVAEQAEINVTLLSDYISLRKLPGWNNAKSLAKVLKCTIDDLYEEEFYVKKKKEPDNLKE
ncbi:hypothetical protein [Brevibacillus sp. SYSU BS000544]|uniref:hypothetical protein n=1 Tax=Brevibacillus sp. SYSU BS000544 TaxID=3416443 RepID=UPI003CE5853A